MKPSRTISNHSMSGTKQSKDRVTVLLTCSATGTEKLKPLLNGSVTTARSPLSERAYLLFIARWMLNSSININLFIGNVGCLFLKAILSFGFASSASRVFF